MRMLCYTTTGKIEQRRKHYADLASCKLTPNRAVTAMYKGTPEGGAPVVLRSYDSRKEPSVEFDCTIWQAGRATCATGLAFKPIQVGQSVFIDEGAGKYNPAPIALDEACVNEWPGRDVGVFVSIGTGRRPTGSDNNQHLWYEGFMGEFAEARRRLIAKIEGCEVMHQYMIREGLSKRGVNIENYYRLNVEIGVGEFGMNEWNRLADISTGTRRYLAKSEIKAKNDEAAVKLAKIHRVKLRLDRESGIAPPPSRGYKDHLPDVPEAYPTAVELPAGDVPPPARSPPPRPSYESGHHDTLEVPEQQHFSPSPRSSVDNHSRISPKDSSGSIHGSNDDRFVVQSPTPSQYRTASGADMIAIVSNDELPKPMEQAPVVQEGRVEPPPLPPKTPLDSVPVMGRGRPQLPYPEDDGPPPPVNMARKPDYKGR
jgi:hypothetical protein